jgi:hypothetical protein
MVFHAFSQFYLAGLCLGIHLVLTGLCLGNYICLHFFLTCRYLACLGSLAFF